MDFVVKECILLAFFLSLSLGAFGAVTEPFINNTVASGFRDETQITCATSLSAENFNWSLWPVGGQRIRAIASGHVLEDFDTFRMTVTEKPEYGNNVSHLFIRIFNALSAGVYTCDEGQKQSAQFIVIFDEESACNFSSQPNETTSSGEISELSCTVKYAANESYVVANVKWSIFGSSESLKSSMETSTSANITTAKSTLKITGSENSRCASIYICTLTFSLTDNLPSGFATKEPDYARACSPNVDACEKKYQPVCNLAPEPNEINPRDEISQLSCTLKHAANAFHVVDYVTWRKDGSPEILLSSFETSTSANITTATSKLNITRSENLKCASIYRCETTFRMTDELPRGLSTGNPGYKSACSLSVPNAATCKEEKSDKKTSEKTDKKTSEKTDKKPGKTTVATPRRNVGAKADENSADKSGETPNVTPGKNGGGKNGGGLSVGSFKRNIVTICVVGIAGLVLIGTGTGV